MRRICHGLLAVVLTGAVGAQAGNAPKDLSLKQWIEPAEVIKMTLSPDGKHVAGLGAPRHPIVFVLEVDTGKIRRLPGGPGDEWYTYPTDVAWVSNDLLALDLSDNRSYSVDLTGKRIAVLGESFIGPLWARGEMTDSVLAFRDLSDSEIQVTNARTGERIPYKIALPGTPIKRAYDSAGRLRAVTMMDTAFWTEKTRVSNWYRRDDQSPWQLLEEGAITDDFWTPMAALDETDSLAILSRKGRDTYAVFRYDTVKRQHGEVMAGHPTEDIVGVEGLNSSEFPYVITNGIKPQTTWFDARWAALQTAVDAALPGRINSLGGRRDGRVVVFSYADVDPGRWYLLDTQTSKMREIGVRRPLIDPDRMRPMATIQYTARDGLKINGYLTRPAQATPGPVPLVVLIHGGPHTRDVWGWDEEVQLLAAHGYAVFQPQFRGSTGFGRSFLEAGYRQWGRAMQDDITDGVKHLIEQGVADKARICIYGGSYGGYAALWGVIKTPELYRCGVSFAGVTDLASHLTSTFLNDSNAVSRELNRKFIGEGEADLRDLDQVSPLKHADRVTVPLLIAHGGKDKRVLPSQSSRMVKALEQSGKAVESIVFDGEGHGLSRPQNQLTFYTRLLSFFQRHLGGLPPAPADAPEPAAAASAAGSGG